MKHIQNFSKFNEEVEMGMLPTDVVRNAPDAYKDVFSGISDLYSDLVDKIGNKMGEIKDAFKGLSKQEVEKIAQFMKKTFGTVKPEMTKENVMKLSKALGLDTISENFKEDENIVVKIIGRIKQALGINVAGTAGLGLATILTYALHLLNKLPMSTSLEVDISMMVTIELAAAGWAALFMFDLIMKMFGYNSDDDIAGIGNYNPNKDIRNKY